MLDKDSAVPLHLQLRDLLRKQILSNELSSHTQLPSERDLCERYAVSRITVRQALGTCSTKALSTRRWAKVPMSLSPASTRSFSP